MAFFSSARWALRMLARPPKTISVPALPLEFDGKRLPKRSDPPEIGEHSAELLKDLGCSPAEVKRLIESRVVR